MPLLSEVPKDKVMSIDEYREGDYMLCVTEDYLVEDIESAVDYFDINPQECIEVAMPEAFEPCILTFVENAVQEHLMGLCEEYNDYFLEFDDFKDLEGLKEFFDAWIKKQGQPPVYYASGVYLDVRSYYEND